MIVSPLELTHDMESLMILADVIMQRRVATLWIQQNSDGQTKPQANNHPSSPCALLTEPFYMLYNAEEFTAWVMLSEVINSFFQFVLFCREHINSGHQLFQVTALLVRSAGTKSASPVWPLTCNNQWCTTSTDTKSVCHELSANCLCK